MARSVKKRADSLPFVSILIVNYNGRGLLGNCLSSVRAMDYPQDRYEVILVDNRSTDDSRAYVERAFPWVKLVGANENLGFTGGNNLALQHASGELIVLLNTDTWVEKDWLLALVRSADLHPSVGIFSSRLRFAHPYLALRIKVAPIQRSDVEESIDFSPLGVMLENVACQESVLDNLVWYESGFYEEINGAITARWTKGEAVLLLPVPLDTWRDGKSATYTFTFHGYQTSQPIDAPVEFFWEGSHQSFRHFSISSKKVRQESITVSAAVVRREAFWLVQNAGNVLMKDGWSKDRGSITRWAGARGQNYEFYEREAEHFLQERALTAFCGASCLIRRELIEDIGFLDGHYYMYYEDAEYSVRAWRMGWDLLYVPESVAYHRHRATTGKTTNIFILHLTERNHLFFTFTHYPLAVFISEFVVFVLRLLNATVRTLLHFLRDDLPRLRRWRVMAKARWLALRDFVQLFSRLLEGRLFFAHSSRRSMDRLRAMMY